MVRYRGYDQRVEQAGTTPLRRRAALAGVLLALCWAMNGCSLRRLAVNQLGNALAWGNSTWASDDDPELVRDAVPFALKTIESLLAESPQHRGLLLAAASGFTQYSYAYLQCEADYLEGRDLAAATALRLRARRLYRRALGYGLRGLEVGHSGLSEALRRDPVAALAGVRKTEVPLLYWTASAWAALISLSKEDGEVTADLPLAVALMERARALDEGFADGSVEDFFIAYEGGMPAAAGGSVERARVAMDRALALARGRRAAPLVSYAETVSVANQNRTEFEALLDRALEVNPDAAPENRLENLIAQRRARWLLGRTDELFLE